MADRVLVTGGAGFIGSHLVRALLVRGDSVCVLDDLSTGQRANLDGVDVELVEGSILDEQALAKAAAGARYVFHLAAQVSVPQSVEDPVGTHRINATGTLRVLEAARQAGVERVVYSASCAAYGDEPTLPKQEASALVPTSPYAASKLLGELYGSAWTRSMGLEVVSLRYFNVFGPRQNPEGGYAAAIPAFVTRTLAGQAIVIHGDGGQTRDFVFVDNVVEANLAAAAAPQAEGQSFNIGSGESTTIQVLVDTIGALADRTPEVSHGPDRPGDIRHSVADVSRARMVLGYRCNVGLEQGLAQTIRWYRDRA